MKRVRFALIGFLVASNIGVFTLFAPAVQAASPTQALPSICYQGYPYTVQPGDDLAQIALKFGLTVPELAAYNDLSTTSVIDSGQLLCINDGTYVTQPGDDLVSIAGRFGVTLAALEQANNVTNPNVLFSGQVLVIPGGEVPVGVPIPFNRDYIVQRGDTLDSIAAHFGISAGELIEANQLTDPSLIEIGQQLTIPDQFMPDVYTVQSGDTLSSIAAQFGTTVGVLAQANNIVNVNFITVGENIVVPVDVP
jgi:LysM repeat protein